MRIRTIIKFSGITVFAAILLSFFIFNFSNLQIPRRNIEQLAFKEDDITNRCGVVKDNFRFCSYPNNVGDLQIAWEETERHSEKKSLRMVFKGSDTEHFLGIHLFLTLNLQPYSNNGVLDFWIKGRKSSLITDLNIVLKSGPLIQSEVRINMPININGNWQNFSLPLSEFHLVKEKIFGVEEFNWEIQELLFSIKPFNSDEPVELFIDSLRIISNNKIIYELF